MSVLMALEIAAVGNGAARSRMLLGRKFSREGKLIRQANTRGLSWGRLDTLAATSQIFSNRLAVLLYSTGKSFLYRHAANVLVFPYGEWWAFRVIDLHLVVSKLTAN